MPEHASHLPESSRVTHVGLWVRDLELMRAFYTQILGGTSGEPYKNPSTGFTSYFVSFAEGPRLELMNRPDLGPRPPSDCVGYAHIALSLGSRANVNHAVAALGQAGVPITSGPRDTGDGYYEAVILDPEGNQVELTV